MTDLDDQVTGTVVITGEEPAEPEAPAAAPESEETAEPQVQASDDDDFDVVVELAKTPEVAPLDPHAKDYSHVDGKITNKDIQLRIKQLTYQSKLNDQRRADAERLANAALATLNALAGKAQALSGEHHNTARAAVTIDKEKTTTDIASAKKEYADAMANGDNEKAAIAQEKLARAVQESSLVDTIQVPDNPQEIAELRQVQQIQQYAQQYAQQAQQQPAVDPTAFQSWLTRNQWYTDPKNQQFSGLANALSSTIESEGYPVDSPEHFAQLDARLRQAAPKAFGVSQPAQQQQQQRSVAPVAATPVNRHQPVAPVGTRTAPTTRRTVTATPEELKFAKEFGLDIKSIIRGRGGVSV